MGAGGDGTLCHLARQEDADERDELRSWSEAVKRIVPCMVVSLPDPGKLQPVHHHDGDADHPERGRQRGERAATLPARRASTRCSTRSPSSGRRSTRRRSASVYRRADQCSVCPRHARASWRLFGLDAGPGCDCIHLLRSVRSSCRSTCSTPPRSSLCGGSEVVATVPCAWVIA